MSNHLNDKDRTFIGRSFLHLDHADSTNSFVLNRKALLRQAGLVVYADEQSAGRGRYGRQWFGIRGGLFASMVAHLPSRFPVVPMPLFAGIALYDAVSDVAGRCQDGLSIKWPNDLLINDKKVAGVLCESREVDKRVVVVIGIGVNICGSTSALPEELRDVTTTLEQEGIVVSRDKLLNSIAGRLDNIITAVCNDLQNHIFQRWCELSSSIGREVMFTLDDRYMTGRIHGLADDGSLLVMKADGSLTKVGSGEVKYLT